MFRIHILTLLLAFATSPLVAQTFEFTAPTVTVPVAPNQPGGTIVLGFAVEQTSGAAASAQGFSMGVAHDPALLSAISVDFAEELIAAPWDAPEFFGTNELSSGWTCAAVSSFDGNWFFSFTVPKLAIEVTYQIASDGPVDTPLSTPLLWTNTLSSPPVWNVVVVDGESIVSEWVHGEMVWVPTSFLRGDMNNDGGINIADIFAAEEYLFLGGETPGCLAALDGNGDEAVDIGDIIYVLSYLFLGGPPMPAPFPTCGPIPEASTMGCNESQCSP